MGTKQGTDVAPRTTPADIEAKIARCFYFTGAEAAQGADVLWAFRKNKRGKELVLGENYLDTPLALLTICVLVLRNGYTVTGESACVIPGDFDAETGRKLARENATSKLRTLMGYALKDRASQS